MAARADPTIEVKVFVDKERSRVIFAESGKEFVDELFGFLTLPLGTVVRLLGKQSQVGCLDELYKSVKGLSADFFRTEACKAMLLKPINAAAQQCCRLNVRVDDAKRDGERPESSAAAAAGSDAGVFVKGDAKFIVTDDFEVAPASTSLMLTLFDKFDVQDPSCLEQRTLHLSSDKMISLLKRSLTSKNALTAHYFDTAIASDDSAIDILTENVYPEQGNDADPNLNDVKIKVLQTTSKNNSSVLYAEVGANFVDLLFGLLCIPLGSIMKTYAKCASKGCVDNLYGSIDGSAQECMRSECRISLLSPKLAPYFGCSTSKLLQVEEQDPENARTTYHLGRDPKSPNGERDSGEGYVKREPRKFMVTDDLQVLPLSLASTLQVVSGAKTQRKDLVEKEIALTKPQVLELLKAALVTRKALTSVFLPRE
ncbi:uncharacterized protein LOC119361129 [Triticum dicoccoides]|uniref:uncharacterized protein LOC119361129 n=1 Tax=Triticum dicoccoides TaxID=85692 RepID=UPI0018900F80|nr:uncharacterized protein LOC119361129 [Triticum dicoccoides]